MYKDRDETVVRLTSEGGKRAQLEYIRRDMTKSPELSIAVCVRSMTYSVRNNSTDIRLIETEKVKILWDVMLRSIQVANSCSRDHVILVITSSRLANGTHFNADRQFRQT